MQEILKEGAEVKDLQLSASCLLPRYSLCGKKSTIIAKARDGESLAEI
jgi:hypothetical protein